MNLLIFDSLLSTNDFLMNLSKKGANSWTVIQAKEQTKGKGYAGNEWSSSAKENLTFSFLLKTTYTFQEMIYFNEWVSNVICEFLESFCLKSNVKWPNDIILNDKKVCGILIENHKVEQMIHSVVGIGLNINQVNFESLPKATSIRKVTDMEYDIQVILTDLMNLFQKKYPALENKEFENIHQLYLKNLFRKDRLSKFKFNDKQIKGIIRGVSESGNLIVEIENISKEFKHKEIELLF